MLARIEGTLKTMAATGQLVRSLLLAAGMLFLGSGCSSVPVASRSLESLINKPLDGRLAAAQLLVRRKEYDKAEAAYNSILRDEPKCVEAWHRLGIVEAKRGKFAEAEVNFEKAMTIGPITAELANDHAYLYFLQDRLSDAEMGFRKAVEISSEFKPAWTNLGLVLGQQGNYDEAFKAFQKAAQNPAEAHCSLAYVYAQSFELEKAQAEYKQALTLDPTLKLAAEGLLQVSAMLPGSEPRTIVATSASPLLAPRSGETPMTAAEMMADPPANNVSLPWLPQDPASRQGEAAAAGYQLPSVGE